MLSDNVDVIRETCSGIKIIKYSAASVAENLLIDEELARKAGSSGKKVLRFWWGGPTAVVLGCSDKPEQAVNADVCEMLGVSVLKRVTGGGAVIQSKGVLNYSLTIPDNGRLDIHRMFGLGADLVISTLQSFGIEAHQQGISDIAINNRKISGNAQAGKWKAVLLHGTILVNVDFELMEAILKHPVREPDYRRGRTHKDFVVNLRELKQDVSDRMLETALASAANKIF